MMKYKNLLNLRPEHFQMSRIKRLIKLKMKVKMQKKRKTKKRDESISSFILTSQEFQQFFSIISSFIQQNYLYSYKSVMYNKFAAEKLKKNRQLQNVNRNRMKNWMDKYQQTIQPEFLDRYNQRLNNFITKIEENPWQLERFEATDVRKQKEEYIRSKIQQLQNKGSRHLIFRDTNDFNSFYNEAERIQRMKNKKLFEKKFGNSDMAYRSIASQSLFNPKNEFRSRQKQKQINPPMKYINKSLMLQAVPKKKAKSVLQNKCDKNYIKQQQQQLAIRKNTSVSGSFIGMDDDQRSVVSVKTQSSSSHRSRIKQKKSSASMSLQEYLKNKTKIKRPIGKSYFVGITDIKLNSNDAHVKKSLHNILVKIGKSHPNARDKALLPNVQILASEIS